MDKSWRSMRGSREGHLWETFETPFLVTEPEGMKQGKFEKIYASGEARTASHSEELHLVYNYSSLSYVQVGTLALQLTLITE